MADLPIAVGMELIPLQNCIEWKGRLLTNSVIEQQSPDAFNGITISFFSVVDFVKMC